MTDIYLDEKITRSRAQSGSFIVLKNAGVRTDGPLAAPDPGGNTAHSAGMSLTEPLPLSTCIAEVRALLGCICDSHHLEASGFDRGCPLHDRQETPC